uniref:Appetite-regulating hormone n=1 Tax=Oryctolagus cuniculus TaxID=9986 RepID=A0A5F9CV37_RABIT|nr:appetite-regulating hormone isoform X2 [Oryctolagus cuniculus]
MLSAGTACSLLLLSVLWVDVAMAGSSFLSPEHQKAQRKDAKKPPARLQPRAEDNGQEEAEDQLQIRFSAPFDVGIQLSGAQYQQHGRALGKILQDILREETKGELSPGSQPQALPPLPPLWAAECGFELGCCPRRTAGSRTRLHLLNGKGSRQGYLVRSRVCEVCEGPSKAPGKQAGPPSSSTFRRRFHGTAMRSEWAPRRGRRACPAVLTEHHTPHPPWASLRKRLLQARLG